MKFKKRQLVLLLMVGMVFGYFVFSKKNSNASPGFTFLLPIVQTVFDPDNSRLSDSLKNAVEMPIADEDGTYGVVIKNLKNQESYSVDEHYVFEAASLYKLWVMATVFQQLQTGKLNIDDELIQEVSVLNDKFNIATDTAELTEGTITATVKDSLEKMITVSDNYSALLLSEKVGLSNVSKFLNDFGFDKSNLGEPPQTTASDIALFFEKLYKGELANKEYTDEMINLLKRQALNEKLPKYLPKNLAIAHKTGELDSFSHDAGIIFAKKDDYIIVVLTDTDDTDKATENIARISKAVYDFFQK